MGTLIGQELYKLTHKVGTWLALAVMVALQLVFVAARLMYPKLFDLAGLIQGDFLADSIIVFIMIASTASIVAMEFQYGTIRQLLYRQYYRSQVFIAKLVTLVLQFILLHVVASLVTFAATALAFPSYSWTAHSWQHYWLGQGGNALTLLMLMSVVLLLATLFKTNAAAISVGFVGYFMAQLASLILTMLIAKWDWLKWLPFTMLMTGKQVIDSSLADMTKLSTNWMIGLTCAYTVGFTVIAYLSFRRRAV